MNVSASARKLDLESASEDERELPESNEGFRFVDIAILTETMATFWCPERRCGHIILKEKPESKKGFASQMILECSARNCKYARIFYTSKTVCNGKAFEVNRRAVLVGRNIGIGHRGLPKFACTMNMPPPMNESSYRDHVSAIHDAAKVVCNESMKNAGYETKQFYEVEEDGKYNIGISADETWRRRGYSSSYGVVAGLSLVTGKVLDTEVMSKECRECILWQGKAGTVEFDNWWEGHQNNCHANFVGSSGAMDAAGCVAIFQRSIEKYGLRYLTFWEMGIARHSMRLQKRMYMRV